MSNAVLKNSQEVKMEYASYYPTALKYSGGENQYGKIDYYSGHNGESEYAGHGSLYPDHS